MNLKSPLKMTLFIDRKLFVIAALSILTANNLAAYEIISPDQASENIKPLVQRLHDEGVRNEVLNSLEISLAALYEKDFHTAEIMVDNAIAAIETVYANNINAEKARSLWYEEGSKNYKGEPYERSMAHYYRGVLDIYKGDYDNAQAAFESGLQQDAFAEEEQYSADFAALAFLRSWSFKQTGNLSKAKEAFDEVVKLRPSTKIPEADDNTLIIIETGKSPRKLSDGVGHFELLFRRGKRIKEEFVEFNDQIPNIVESIYFQASTRGGRPIDGIIEGKVNFKAEAAQTGEVLGDIGQAVVHASAVTGSGTLQGVGLGIGVVGIIGTAMSANTRTEADTRYWSNLPDKIHIFTSKLQLDSLDENNFNIFVKNKNGEVLKTEKLNVSIIHNNSGFVWLKTHSAYETVKGER